MLLYVFKPPFFGSFQGTVWNRSYKLYRLPRPNQRRSDLLGAPDPSLHADGPGTHRQAQHRVALRGNVQTNVDQQW